MNAAESSFLVIIAVLIAFYLIFLRPMQQEQRKRQQDIKDLQVGDEVLTTGGLIGRVKDVYVPDAGPVQIVIDFGNGIEINAVASAIAQRVAAGQTLFSGALDAEEKRS
jgi:preprotein translocase subunit YajC